MKNGRSILELTDFVNIAVSVVIEKDGQFLMIQEAKPEIFGKWNFPTGKVELHENILEAARREAREETGFEVELLGLVSVYYINWDRITGYDHKKGVTVRFNLKARLADEKCEPMDLAPDVLSTSWKSLTDIAELEKNNELRSESSIRLAHEVESGKLSPLDTLFTR